MLFDVVDVHPRHVDGHVLRWVAARWGIRLAGGEGFRAIHRLLDSEVEYRRMEAFALGDLDERFDFVYCCGILHRVENPLGLLPVLRGRTVSGGSVLIETYGVGPEHKDGASIRVSQLGRCTKATSSCTGDSGSLVSSGLRGSRASPRSRRCTPWRSTVTRGSSGDSSPDRRRSASSPLLHSLVADS